MNAEELKQLKPGDDIFIRAKFVRVFDDGDVLFTHTNTSGDEEVVKTEEYTHPSNVILPSEAQPAPKYEPAAVRAWLEARVAEKLNAERKEQDNG